jgi:hypothetical protein
MSKALRYLRIAFSATCVIVAVLVCALWVRSYTIADGVTRLGKTELVILSFRGVLDFGVNGDPSAPHIVGTGWIHYENDVTGDSVESLPYRFGFHIANLEDGSWAIPHWFAAMLCVGMAAAAWFRWRFSLRTLLIATTLIAVVLGLIVWAVR